MKRKIVAGLAAAFMICAAGTNLAAKGSRDNGYQIATDSTFAPFEFQDENGAYVGIDVELLAAIAEDQGFRYTLNPLGFSAAVAALESSQADGVIAGMSITAERQLKYDFSAPYYDSGVVMAIRADNTQIKSYADLRGRRVAVKTGTEGATFAEGIREQYGFTLVYFDESPFMYAEVASGNSAACFEDFPVMGYGISRGNGLKIVTPMERGSSYGFAVLKGKNGDLLRMFNAGLANLRASGRYQAILDKYISTN
ncbi:MAG: transporter substrate-binding domain-containing protein [Spirochaetaceae bacterium]|jgi:polar amino acid transport system substrate-binding protein|nr:transporter substrate-binding domain-containing protein [Spirochaetaceae bacterium]